MQTSWSLLDPYGVLLLPHTSPPLHPCLWKPGAQQKRLHGAYCKLYLSHTGIISPQFYKVLNICRGQLFLEGCFSIFSCIHHRKDLLDTVCSLNGCQVVQTTEIMCLHSEKLPLCSWRSVTLTEKRNTSLFSSLNTSVSSPFKLQSVMSCPY